MKFSTKLMTVVFAALLLSSEAFAFFDAQLLVGQRNGKVNDEEAGSQEIGAAFHVDPIIGLPVAFGVYANSMTFEDSDTSATDGMKGLEAGAQVYAWFPIGIAGVKPYAKVGVPLYSAIKGSTDVGGTSMDLLWETSGMHLNFGAGYSPIPGVSFLLEFGLGQQKINPKTVKVAGSEVDASSLGLKEEDYKTTGVLVGIEVGL